MNETAEEISNNRQSRGSTGSQGASIGVGNDGVNISGPAWLILVGIAALFILALVVIHKNDQDKKVAPGIISSEEKQAQDVMDEFIKELNKEMK